VTAYIVEFDGRHVWCETMADQWACAMMYAARFPRVTARRTTPADKVKA
jgi:hypothetical protein